MIRKLKGVKERKRVKKSRKEDDRQKKTKKKRKRQKDRKEATNGRRRIGRWENGQKKACNNDKLKRKN